MLGIIEIKGEVPKQLVVKKALTYKGGFFYIKFKVENNKEDLDLLFDIFGTHLSDCFSGLREQPKELFDDEVILNEEQTIYYDYQTNEITIR